MEREIKPMLPSKPWEELTQEERQIIHNSWQNAPLPDEYDVFCMSDWALRDDLNVPCILYIKGNFNVFDMTVGGDCIIDGYVYASGDVTVRGTCLVDGDFDAFYVTMHKDCFISHEIDCCELKVRGFLDCYDVDSNGEDINVADYVCHYYYEKN